MCHPQFLIQSGGLSALFNQTRHRRSISFFSSMSQATEGWYDATVLLPSLVEDEKSRSLSDIAVRDEAKEVRPDAKP